MTENQVKKPRKRPIRSGYLFPSYDFGVARRIAERVERDGAGNLSEETLAIALGTSAKSSGFRLRRLATCQFGLLTKQGDMLRTTPLSKAIIKPTNETERDRATVESFLNVPLFKAISTRFKGQPLPQGEAFRNILEREFRIQSNRVNEAERIFKDSAREAGLLQTSGSNTYLVTQTISVTPPAHQIDTDVDSNQRLGTLRRHEDEPKEPTYAQHGFLNISEQDLAEFNDKEFEEIWRALGKIVRVKGKRQKGEIELTEEDTGEKE